MAKSVFGDSIDYSAVRIHNGKGDGLLARAENYASKFFGAEDVADRPQASGDQVLFPPKDYCDDFSKPQAPRGTFIHELTHVWQFQHHLAGPAIREAKDVVGNGFRYDHTYGYKLDPGKDLMDYNLEQQADIVGAYFDMKNREAHPPPPPEKATAEKLEKSLFGRMILKSATEMRAQNKETPQAVAFRQKGLVVFDREGQAHFTQKYADKVNDDNAKERAEQAQNDVILKKVMAKFAANPGYAAGHDAVNEVIGTAERVATDAAVAAGSPIIGLRTLMRK